MIKYAVVDRRMEEDMRSKLEAEAYKIVESYDHKNLYDAIRSHVDIGLFAVGDKLIASKESYAYYQTAIGDKLLKHSIISGSRYLGLKYPEDIAYNFSFSGKYGIGKLDNIDPAVIDVVLDQVPTSELIDVRQGYAACSICWVDERSLITSDRGIAKVLRAYDIDVLEIDKGHIDLFDMDYGFIGGATSSLEDGRIVFFGDVYSHPDGERMVEFIRSKSKEYLCLSSGRLKDYGGMLVICE